MRVGSPKLDNYHRVRGREPRPVHLGRLAYLRRQRQLHQAAVVAGDRSGLSHGRRTADPHQDQYPGEGGGEDNSDDFSSEPPSVAVEAPPQLKFDEAEWTGRMRTLSARFGNYSARADLARVGELPDGHLLPGQHRGHAHRARPRFRARGHDRGCQGRRRHGPEHLRDIRSRGCRRASR